jgi:hypothetical protein
MEMASFWEYIESLLTKGFSKPNKITKELKSFSKEELESFFDTFLSFYNLANNWGLWGVAYILRDGCSEKWTP